MRDDGVTKQDVSRSAVCWLRVDVEPTPWQKFLRPFFILDAREFLRRRKERSFMGVSRCGEMELSWGGYKTRRGWWITCKREGNE